MADIMEIGRVARLILLLPDRQPRVVPPIPSIAFHVACPSASMPCFPFVPLSVHFH